MKSSISPCFLIFPDTERKETNRERQNARMYVRVSAWGSHPLEPIHREPITGTQRYILILLCPGNGFPSGWPQK